MRGTQITGAGDHERIRMKTVLRRLQQLEQRRSELLAVDFSSGARDHLLARISQMADPSRGDLNRESTPHATVDELRQRVREAAGHKSETCHPRTARR
jgi:hypothetical protein